MPVYELQAYIKPWDVNSKWLKGKSVRVYFSKKPERTIIVSKPIHDRANKAIESNRPYFRAKFSKKLIQKNMSASGFFQDFVRGFKMPFEFLAKDVIAPVWNSGVKPAINMLGKDVIRPIVSEVKDVIGSNKDEVDVALDIAKLVKPEWKEGLDIGKRVVNMVPKKGKGLKNYVRRPSEYISEIVERAVPKRVGSGVNSWNQEVAQYRKKYGVSLKDAMRECSKLRKLGKGSKNVGRGLRNL